MVKAAMINFMIEVYMIRLTLIQIVAEAEQ